MCEAKENKEKKQIEKSGNYMVLGSPKHTVKKLQKTEVGIFNWKEKKSLIMELVERPESEERAVVFCWRDWRVVIHTNTKKVTWKGLLSFIKFAEQCSSFSAHDAMKLHCMYSEFLNLRKQPCKQSDIRSFMSCDK